MGYIGCADVSKCSPTDKPERFHYLHRRMIHTHQLLILAMFKIFDLLMKEKQNLNSTNTNKQIFLNESKQNSFNRAIFREIKTCNIPRVFAHVP